MLTNAENLVVLSSFSQKIWFFMRFGSIFFFTKGLVLFHKRLKTDVGPFLLLLSWLIQIIALANIR